MDVPYGFDCYTFKENEVKYFDSNIVHSTSGGIVPYSRNITESKARQGFIDSTGRNLSSYIRFTRKNEYYTNDQLNTLARAGKLNMDEFSKQIFCGIKIQIGIGVVSSFLKTGLQYKKPVKGRSEFVNGKWTGIVNGLTEDQDAPNSYDIAFGNFLAYDEEFPYMKFGPFFAIESKLVMLTGSPRGIETSSFGTNIRGEIWLTILSFMLILSLLASFRMHWQHSKLRVFRSAVNELLASYSLKSDENSHVESQESQKSVLAMIHHFFFIYFTMLLNKPSLEFDDYIWPKHNPVLEEDPQRRRIEDIYGIIDKNDTLRDHYKELLRERKRRKKLPTSVRVLSYLWSAACLVMASIYSGEMLAVILLRADQNIDTVPQLITSKPPIEPVIRQDDFTYNLMLKSLDTNLLVLHNMTTIIPRPDVYTRQFIENVSDRKKALLGDDELIETIYDIYHKYFPLYKSKITYLQYPISVIYRKDLNVTLEAKLRRGIVQLFETGLIQRWYQAQKDTYIQFYDSEKKDKENDKEAETTASSSDQKYKPLSMHHFESFSQLMLLSLVFAFIVLITEIVHYRVVNKTWHWNQCG